MPKSKNTHMLHINIMISSQFKNQEYPNGYFSPGAHNSIISSKDDNLNKEI